MKLNDKAIKVLNKLNESGYEAYLVGGCVRDFVMGKNPFDYDITTSALPGEIKSLFEKTIDTGIKHGTVTVVCDGEFFEVTTFRSESEYEKNRKPQKVEFVKSLEEDLKRRDFTMNAMCLDRDGTIADLFNGMEDIKNKTIRCVGEAELRFEEDALRMLRLVRFACKTGFDIEEKTYEAVIKKAHLIKNISVERIKSEIDGALMGAFVNKLSFLRETGLEEYIFKNARYDLIEKAPFNVCIRWALLLVDNENPKEVLDSLKFDNKSKRKILSFLENKNAVLKNDEYFLKCFVYEKKIADFKEYMDFRCTVDSGLIELKEKYKNFEVPSLKDLEIDGNVLLELGFEKNEIGKVLEKLLYVVFENDSLNTEEILKEKARGIKCSGN